MLTITKIFKFEAAHFLPHYEGVCKEVHGHSYKLEVGIGGPIDGKSGMVIDFSRLKLIVNQEIIDHLDHSFLNELKSEPGELGINFPWENPTAENMVQWIGYRLQNRWDGTREDGEVVLLRLWETTTSHAEWKK